MIMRLVEIGCMGLLFAVVVLQTTLRTVFHEGLSWPEEVARLCLIVITFAAGSEAFKAGEHIRISILSDNLPGSLRRVASGIAVAGCLVFLTLMVFSGGKLAILGLRQRAVTLPIPMGVVLMVIPLTGVAASIHILSSLVLGGSSTDEETRGARGGETCPSVPTENEDPR